MLQQKNMFIVVLFIGACDCVVCIYVFLSREHLSEEDLRKNKAMLEGLTKGQLVDNPEVMYSTVSS